MLFYENHKVYMNGEYPAIWLNGRNQHIHRLQWLKYHGEIPKGYIVHHIDGNKMNWEIKNLQLLLRNEHIRKHKDVVRRKKLPVIAIKDNVVMRFDSIEEAAVFCGTYTSCIHKIFNGKQSTANGWKFTRGRG